ncbi:hypothetical protein [Defluviitalea saccharophila]|jgi:acetylglutamate kinase|uniref:DUF2642 domain-containing protein n=1 Tax=Defluviitalea saccharophila TaxID=879970 RepID=A0ABZ2Y5K4_9FIRM|nr:hypothetical protein [Candidatus Epulonipiscium sp.]
MKRKMEVQGARRNKNNNVLPASIKDILKRLIDEEVVIVLKSGKCEEVDILGVEGNLLIASPNGDIKFIDIDCICEVIAEPEDVIEALFRERCCNS